MVKKIEKVDRIAIEKNKIVIYSSDMPRMDFTRETWDLFIDDVQQVQVFPDYTVIFPKDYPKGFIACEVEEHSRRIFCGKKPEEVRYL